jgi:hypothetical protein
MKMIGTRASIQIDVGFIVVLCFWLLIRLWESVLKLAMAPPPADGAFPIFKPDF